MFLPRSIQSFLERNHSYLKFRYSRWVYSFWLLLRRDVRKEIGAKKKLYQILFSGGCQFIFDIGANEGVLTEIFSHLSQRVIAVEPSARNISILKARFGNQKKVEIVEAAISNTNGQQTWYEDRNNFAMGTLSSKWNRIKNDTDGVNERMVSTFSLDDLISKFGRPGYIKIDIEGHEWQAIQSLSQPVSLLSFEAILPQFYEETILCIQYVAGLHIEVTFNYLIENKFAYSQYQKEEIILADIKDIRHTIDIFCKMNIHLF